MKIINVIYIFLFTGMIFCGTTHSQLSLPSNALLHYGKIESDHADSIVSGKIVNKFVKNNLQKQRTTVEKDTTIHLSAGTLSTLLTDAEKATITNLQLTGTIDARDFKTMRDSMPLLVFCLIRIKIA